MDDACATATGGALVCGDAVTNSGEIAIALDRGGSDCREGAPREPARREFEIATFGHGDPVVGGAAAVLRAALA